MMYCSIFKYANASPGWLDHGSYGPCTSIWTLKLLFDTFQKVQIELRKNYTSMIDYHKH